ncbi:MAG: hypothetical protein EAZ95_02595 [Bacteroidetes bacterium]|nr:MAG: hypothetical protein EAZ95_02595 [Bacteroidota bacterium]
MLHLGETYPFEQTNSYQYHFIATKYYRRYEVYFTFPSIEGLHFKNLGFDYTNLSEAEAGEDNMIMPTVLAIIADYLTQNPETVLLYVCETKDRKEQARERLFSRLFTQCNNGQYLKQDYIFEGTNMRASAIIPQNHTDFAHIQEVLAKEYKELSGLK